MSEDMQKSGGSSIAIVVILAMLVVAAALVYSFSRVDKTTESERTLGMLGVGEPITNALNEKFVDKDGDLLADPPKDETKWIDPEVLTFSFIPTEKPTPEERDAEFGVEKAKWASFVKHLEATTGKKVEYLRVDTIDEQLQKLASGELHVAGLNTGSVPTAVNLAGFRPVAAEKDEKGNYNYEMHVIVPKDSPIRSLKDIQGRSFTFTDKKSNSGFKAAVIALREHRLRMVHDYDVRFSGSHDRSIKGIAAGDFEAASVASDILTQAITDGEVSYTDFKTIYESTPFTVAGLGYLYNIKPELAGKIEQAFKTYEVDGKPVFAEVDYKKDWDIVRRIENELGIRQEIPETAEALAKETE